MKSLAKLLIAVVLLVAAAYAGVKSYIYTQTREAVQQLVTTTAPFVTIEYGGIGSDLWSGTVRIENIKLSPTGINDSVNVAAARISAGNLRHLFRLMRQAKERALPDVFSVALQEVRLDLNGEIATTADRFLSIAAEAKPGARAAHCANQSTADFAFLRKLGYGALVSDIKFDYDFNKPAELLKLAMVLTMHDMTRVAIDAKLAGVPQELANAEAKPQVREVGLVVQDLSYNDRLKGYCAQVAKLTEQAYLDAESGPGSMFFRQLGVTPGPGLQQAYREFLSKPRSGLEVRVHPNEGFDISSAMQYKPLDVMAMLNATVSVNGKRIEDLSFEFGGSAMAQAPEPKTGADGKRAPTLKSRTEVPAGTARERLPEGFRAVQVGELSRYLNHYVRLHERGQSPREGMLVQMSGGSAVLERQYGTGHVVLKVPLARIDKAEVQY